MQEPEVSSLVDSHTAMALPAKALSPGELDGKCVGCACSRTRRTPRALRGGHGDLSRSVLLWMDTRETAGQPGDRKSVV